MKTIEVRQYHIELFGWDGGTAKPVIYLNAFPGEGEKIWEMAEKDFVLAAITGFDWNAEMSPWKADKTFGGGEDFAGKAREYLDVLTEELIPAAEAELSFTVQERGIAGYSMAGLFAAYAIYRTDLFSLMASVSGSLWFDGFLDFALSHSIASEKIKIYLSLGTKEHRVKNSRMAAVKECTESLAAHWQERYPVIYEKNAGGHFCEPAHRVAKGLGQLIKLNQ